MNIIRFYLSYDTKSTLKLLFWHAKLRFCHIIMTILCLSYINHLGDNCIQNFYLVRYIIGYTVGNSVLQRCASGTVKRDFRKYIRRYTSPNENFEYGYPHSNALLQFELKFERCKPHKAARHPTKCDVINDVKLFPTVYRRIHCRKYLTLSNQTPCYKLMRIRIVVYPLQNLVLYHSQTQPHKIDFFNFIFS